MFNRKTKETIGRLDKFFDIVDQSLLVFIEGVKNYIYRNDDALNGNLQTITKLESEAEMLRRDIETDLYRRTSLSRPRGDILRLLERMDHVLDTISNNLYQFEIERPNIPVELNSEFLKLMELSTEAMSTTIPASKAYFKTPDSVPDMVHRVYFFQKEADTQAKILKRRVFHEMDSLKLSEKFHLRYFALHIEELSQEALKVADQLSVMSIRRII